MGLPLSGRTMRYPIEFVLSCQLSISSLNAGGDITSDATFPPHFLYVSVDAHKWLCFLTNIPWFCPLFSHSPQCVFSCVWRFPIVGGGVVFSKTSFFLLWPYCARESSGICLSFAVTILSYEYVGA
ncbi:MAG TPA: hypothetical protein DCE42_12115 [Myxococcales bacterium]|nr:hypothetical protein [Myxococcales bacterium]